MPRLLVTHLLSVAFALSVQSQNARADTESGKSVVPRRVVLAPLSTLGSHTQSSETKRLRQTLERALSTMAGVTTVPAATVRRAIRRGRAPELRVCDADASCLAKLGVLVKADEIISAELGGLGDARVVYLKLVSATTRQEVRSTTLQLGGLSRDADEQAAQAAAVRLLAPADYVGWLTVKTPAKGARVFIDGKLARGASAGRAAVSVGTHALRVTHPQYRDDVRFVDVGFHQHLTVNAKLERFAVVQSELDAITKPNTDTRPVPARWYRKWYVVAGTTVVLFVGATLTARALTGGIDADQERTLGLE